MITYPVDYDNTLWAIWSIGDAELKSENKKWPRSDGQPISHKDPDKVPLLEVTDAQPAYDSATERPEPSTPVVDIPNNTHNRGWNIVALTQQEMDDEAEGDAAKALYSALKSHSGNSNNRLGDLENAVAYLLKDMYGSS